jgi:hypothetical protein
MKEIQLPTTFRISINYWFMVAGILFLFLVIFSGLYWFLFYILADHNKFSILIPASFFLLLSAGFLANGIILRLDVTSAGFRYRCANGTFNMVWHQIKSVEYEKNYVPRSGDQYTFSVHGNDQDKPIRIGRTLFSKDDYGQFFRILKSKAPHAKLDPKVLELLG